MSVTMVILSSVRLTVKTNHYMPASVLVQYTLLLQRELKRRLYSDSNTNVVA